MLDYAEYEKYGYKNITPSDFKGVSYKFLDNQCYISLHLWVYKKNGYVRLQNVTYNIRITRDRHIKRFCDRNRKNTHLPPSWIHASTSCVSHVVVLLYTFFCQPVFYFCFCKHTILATWEFFYLHRSRNLSYENRKWSSVMILILSATASQYVWRLPLSSCPLP